MNSMLSRLKAMQASQVRDVVANLDASSAPRGLRRRFEQIRNKKQGGFTLLELLVVVAILATIAATATIMLEDTDRKASAAAHVTIMDELVKGVATFRVLHQGQMPTRWDSLMTNATGTILGATKMGNASETDFGLDSGLGDMLSTYSLTDANVTALNGVGITSFKVVSFAATDPNGTSPGNCSTLANIKAMIEDKASDITNSSIFMDSATRGGCGATFTFADPPAPVTTEALARLNSAENYRIGLDTANVVVALGFGHDMTLFDSVNLGRMTGAPFYRHVDGTTYNRFIGLFDLGTSTVPLTEARFISVIDGSGDTKEEELAEWDNTRSTL